MPKWYILNILNRRTCPHRKCVSCNWGFLQTEIYLTRPNRSNPVSARPKMNTQKAFITLQKKWSFSLRFSLSKCDQIRSFLRIWSHLLKKSMMENFTFCAVLEFLDLNLFCVSLLKCSVCLSALVIHLLFFPDVQYSFKGINCHKNLNLNVLTIFGF